MAGVGVAFEMVDDVGAREELLVLNPARRVLVPDVAVEIDERRHHRLAGQVDTDCTSRSLNRARSANTGDAVAFHEECGVLDGGAAITDDDPGTLEQGWRPCGLCTGGLTYAG